MVCFTNFFLFTLSFFQYNNPIGIILGSTLEWFAEELYSNEWCSESKFLKEFKYSFGIVFLILDDLFTHDCKKNKLKNRKEMKKKQENVYIMA